MLIENIILIVIIVAVFTIALEIVLNIISKEPRNTLSKFTAFAGSILPVLLIIFCFRSFAFEGFRIPSGSMKPTLLEGDLVIVDKYSFGLRIPVSGYRLSSGRPKRGEIAVFKGEIDGTQIGMIKRIVGLPGDHIKYKNRVLYINGSAVVQTNIQRALEIDLDGDKTDVIQATEILDSKKYNILLSWHSNNLNYKFSDLIVPDNSYFVVGDYRDNSSDSRDWGVISDQQIVGKARLVVLNIDLAKKTIHWSRNSVV